MDWDDDKGLVAAARDGSEHAFNMLIDRHQQAVRTFLRGLTANHPDADDIAQETFLAAWTQAKSFRGEGSVRSWLFSIAWRKAQGGHRRWFRAARRDTTYHEFSSGDEAKETPAEDRIALRQALLSLPLDHAEALATHGGVQAMMASFQQQPELAAKGVAEMNRAVELAPKSTRVRLVRAFNGLSLPEALRNNAAEAEDLDFLIQVAEGSRPGDYLHIMRGDLYFELGKLELARNQYERAGKSASPAAAEANARLVALTQGGIANTDIKKLRSAAGANCAMCHGR